MPRQVVFTAPVFAHIPFTNKTHIRLGTLLQLDTATMFKTAILAILLSASVSWASLVPQSAITEVTTAEELARAISKEDVHIRITEHLDLRGLEYGQLCDDTKEEGCQQKVLFKMESDHPLQSIVVRKAPAQRTLCAQSTADMSTPCTCTFGWFPSRPLMQLHTQHAIQIWHGSQQRTLIACVHA